MYVYLYNIYRLYKINMCLHEHIDISTFQLKLAA